jgi:type II secretory pathway predicted ATPase ExeA
MDYLKFYDLRVEPFKNDFSRRFYFESDAQRRARLRLLRGVEQKKGLSVLIGGPGCGKTTLANNLLVDLVETEWAVRMILVPHSACAHGWLLPQLSTQFGVDEPATHIPQLLEQIGTRLAEVREGGQHPVLFVDEAQLFRNVQAMEELRGLLNLVQDGEKLISIVLFGLPELSDVIALDPSLAQRVDIRVELRAMEREEASAYLRHRLECAGAGDIMESAAIDAICRYSAGVPRVLNTLADNALFEGFVAETNPVDASIVSSAADDLGLCGSEDAPPPTARLEPPAAPYVEGSPEATHSTPLPGPPLPPPSASEVPTGDTSQMEEPPVRSRPSAWESELWEEEDEEPSIMGFDSLPGESGELTEDKSSFEEADAGGTVEPSADALEEAELELDELLQLPTDSEAEEFPAALEADEPVAVLEPDDDLELEISAIEDDLDELEEEAPLVDVPVAVSGAESEDAQSADDSGFDLGSLLGDMAELAAEPPDVEGRTTLLGSAATDSEADDDDIESLFDAIKLPDA